MIGAGNVHIKQGVEILAFTRNGVVFSDGSEAYADAVILA